MATAITYKFIKNDYLSSAVKVRSLAAATATDLKAAVAGKLCKVLRLPEPDVRPEIGPPSYVQKLSPSMAPRGINHGCHRNRTSSAATRRRPAMA